MSTAARRAYGFVAWLLTPIGVISTQAVALLGLLGALRLFTIRDVRKGLAGEIASPLGLLLVLAVAWMVAACIWTIHPGKALYLAARIAVVLLGGLAFLAAARVMDADDVRRVQITFCKVAIFYVAFLALELADNGVITRAVRGIPLSGDFNFAYLDRGGVVLAMFAWPFAHAFYRRHGKIAAIVFLVLAAACLSQTVIATAKIALGFSAAIFLLTRWRPETMLKVLRVAVPLFCLLAPPALIGMGKYTSHTLEEMSAALPHNLGSLAHRFLIWDFAIRKTAERPFFGWGFDASRAIPGGQQKVFDGSVAMPLHPHNGLLQIWLELGMVGGVIAAAIAFAAFSRMLQLAAVPNAAAFAAALAVTYITIALVSFGIWQNWWMATLWVAIGFAAVPIHEEVAAATAPPTA